MHHFSVFFFSPSQSHHSQSMSPAARLFQQNSSPAKSSPTLQTLDSSSEFIFGESVNSPLSNFPENIKFLECFKDAKSGVGVRFFLGRLRFLHCDSRFRDACRYVNAWTQQRVDRAFERAQWQGAAAK